ncbi:MAG: radical SAM protein [Nitrospirota bacterium]
MLRYKEIFLGNRCNNKCLYCSHRHEEPSMPDFQQIVSSLRRTNERAAVLSYGEGAKESQAEEDGVLLYGGEPSLRGDLPELIYSARRNGYRRIKLATNGRFLSDMRFLQQILNAGCYLFEVKMWASNPQLHDNLTQTPGSFVEAMRGLENLIKFPDEKFVSIRIPVCQKNYTDIENTVALGLSFGINRIILSLLDHQPTLKQVLPHIKNAINISIFNRVWILTEGLPFCAMQDLEPHIGEIYYGWQNISGRKFKKHQYCTACVYEEICPGIDENHLKIFSGNEFSPVKESRYVQDIKVING